MQIRQEDSHDFSAVYKVNSSAFATSAEAQLVDTLRNEAHPVISLVADENGQIIGHIMFSPVTLSGNPGLKIMGLGPMAVIPTQQGKGIGSALVKAGLDKCHAHGYGAVVVLGHTWFYPRFGFRPSTQYGIRSEYDVPDDVFMIVELQKGYLQGSTGTIQYHPAFKGV
jgi:putative acetyltransferase